MRYAILFGVLFSFAAGVSHAETPPRASVAKDRGGARRQVHRMPDIHIDGKVHRPAALYVLPRADAAYSWPDLEQLRKPPAATEPRR